MTEAADGREQMWDCGDNSCYFTRRNGRAGTNGGCRCLENHGYPSSVLKALPVLVQRRYDAGDAVGYARGVAATKARQETELHRIVNALRYVSHFDNGVDMCWCRSWLRDGQGHSINCLEARRVFGLEAADQRAAAAVEPEG